MMTTPADRLPTIYRFADLTLDSARRRVTRQGQPIELKALDFDLLCFLVESAPNVVNADVLAEKVWGRHFVSPENVAQRVMLLRQSLADDASHPRYIETVRNKGYRLIPDVERIASEETNTAPRRRNRLLIAAALLLAVGLTAATSYWLAGTAERPPPLPSSVAVLPFENLSPDPDDAFFAAGMQVEIVSQLTKISGLAVFPMQPGADLQRSISDVRRALNVATVLGGSVNYAEGRVRVNTYLIDAASNQSLWSNSYAHERSDIFAIQSHVALDVAQALRLELSAAERERVERAPTTNPQARLSYLVARGLSPTFSREEVLRAVAEVEKAVTLDPEFKEAWAYNSGLRNGYAQFVDPEHIEEHRQRGEQAAERALEIDPEFGAAHAALGLSRHTKRDWTGAEEAFRKAKSLNVPLTGLGSYAFLQLAVGKFDGFAREIFEAAQAADPTNELFYRFLAFVHEGLGELARANEFYESGFSVARADSREVRLMHEQRMHWRVGRNELAAARTSPPADPLHEKMLAGLDTPDQALAALHRAYDAAAGDPNGDPNNLRNIGLWAGHFRDPALALAAMRAALDKQGGLTPYLWLPQLKEMRRLPEFKAYLRKIGMVAYWQKYGWPTTFCRELDEHDFECN